MTMIVFKEDKTMTNEQVYVTFTYFYDGWISLAVQLPECFSTGRDWPIRRVYQ